MQLVGTGEPGVALVERDVAAPVGAVVPPGRGDRVDPAEHAVADVGPAHLVDGRVDPQMAGPAHGAGEVGGVHEHLGGDAADVEAGAAERPVLDERHVEVLEPRVEERVARAGADDDQVVVPHGQRQSTCGLRLASLALIRRTRVGSVGHGRHGACGAGARSDDGRATRAAAPAGGRLRRRAAVRLRRVGRPRPRSRHRPLRARTGRRPLAYLRLLSEAGGERRIGRVCTAASARGAGWAGGCWRRRCGRPATRRACSTPRSTSLGCTVDSALSRAAPATTGTGFRTCPCAARPGEPDPMQQHNELHELSKEEDTAT